MLSHVGSWGLACKEAVLLCQWGSEIKKRVYQLS